MHEAARAILRSLRGATTLCLRPQVPIRVLLAGAVSTLLFSQSNAAFSSRVVLVPSQIFVTQRESLAEWHQLVALPPA